MKKPPLVDEDDWENEEVVKKKEDGGVKTCPVMFIDYCNMEEI